MRRPAARHTPSSRAADVPDRTRSTGFGSGVSRTLAGGVGGTGEVLAGFARPGRRGDVMLGSVAVLRTRAVGVPAPQEAGGSQRHTAVVMTHERLVIRSRAYERNALRSRGPTGAFSRP